MHAPDSQPRTARFRPWHHGVGAALTVCALGAVSLSASWFLGGQALKSALDEELSMVASLAAQRIDAEAHAQLTDPSQQDSEEYRTVVAPLRDMRASVPAITYLYTMRMTPRGVEFVVDAADEGDLDNDGRDDQAKLCEVYTEADSDTLEAVREGVALVSDQPYTDQWGTFITAFAPVRRADGALECVVGVDMAAETYMERRAMMTRAVKFGGLLTLVGSCGVGLMVAFIERGRRAADAEVRSAARRKDKIASQVPGMIYQFRVGADGSYSFPYASRKMLDLFGVAPEAARENAASVFASIHPDDLPTLMSSIERSRESQSPWQCEFRARSDASAGYRWLHGNSVPEPQSSAGTLWHGFVSDVTESRAEEHFRREQLTLAADLSAASTIAEAAAAVNASLIRSTGLERTAVLLYNHTGKCQFVGWQGLSDEYRAAVEGHCPWRQGETGASLIVVDDAETDASLAAYRDLFRREGIGSLVFIPVVSDAGVAGKLMLYGPRAGDMTPERLQSAQGAASLLGLTVGRLLTREALEVMALTDRLTGLPNSALLHDRMEGVMARAARHKGRHYAVCFLDFDRFKLVNDTLGHEAGDELLRAISDRLRGALRSTDTLSRASDAPTISRMGGDEFVIVLDDLTGPGDVITVADRLLNVLSAPYVIAGQSVTSTASMGIVLGDARYTRPAELLRDADTAMYEAKAAGRGRWVMFDGPMRTRLLRRAELERDLRGAAARGELQVYYQPVVSLETGAWTGMEALARWTSPRHGAVSPAEFIPIAEESDLISDIGSWVFARACQDLARWRREGVLPEGVTIAVNLSRRQLTSVGVSEQLGATVRDAGLCPRDLCIEITETAVMRDKQVGIRMLEALRAQGFSLSLDDFGTGHSSLASLREFPINTVKIDRSFIACVSQGRYNAAMMHALTDLSRNIGMAIVAEGVEDADQVALLQAIGCGLAQGYFFGKPMPADMVPEAARAAREHHKAA